VVARAQQPAMPSVGWLSLASPDEARQLREVGMAAVKQGLAVAGFVEGRNIAFEYRWGRRRTRWSCNSLL
jgi:putative ABC transport system substrate-binding protein